jgi:DNA-binding NarL/FixJ family response regulator
MTAAPAYRHPEVTSVRVFIVEDSPAVLERLQDMVRDIEDVELVGNAATYATAVAGIIAARPDVSILDIKLADDTGSGIDVLGRVRQDLPRMRAVMLSNYVTPQHEKASADAGADYFLDKSADTDRIPAILEQMRDDLRAA